MGGFVWGRRVGDGDWRGGGEDARLVHGVAVLITELLPMMVCGFCSSVCN